MRVSSYDAAALEAQIGARGAAAVNSGNRALVQNWLVANGVPSVRAKAMKVTTLWKCYNKPRYLSAVLAYVESHGAAPDIDTRIDDMPAPVDAPLLDDPAPAITTPAYATALPAVAPNDAGAQLAALITSLAAGAINEARVIELIAEHAPRPRQHEIVVVDTVGERRAIGTQHRQFEQLLRACAARDHSGNRLNIWLAGPAGSGKTTAAENVAKALGLAFHFNGAIDNEYKLLGFTDANGRIVSRPFREAYQNGGVYLFDEVDRSLPGALLAFNAALANGVCDFPDGTIARHPDCVIIAAGNTWGLGGTTQYVGAMKQDAAFVDRFAFLLWEIDEALETAACPNAEWCSYVQRVRERVVANGVQGVMVSPRASFIGASLLAAGLDRDTVIAMTIRKGMSAEQWGAVA
ncbi:MAG TPA: AAA family ATPase [Ramlibacter sp.]|nr:AAA family ATPase [Ramlibacter sp.]